MRRDWLALLLSFAALGGAHVTGTVLGGPDLVESALFVVAIWAWAWAVAMVGRGQGEADRQ